MEDFAVAVGHGSEIQAGHGQAVGGGFVALSVPERLHDVEAGVFAHGCSGALKNAGGLFFGETVQELAHPDRVKTGWERNFRIKQVGRMGVDTVRAVFAFGRFAHQADLLRQIHDGDFDFGIVVDALLRPAAGIAADIEQFF